MVSPGKPGYRQSRPVGACLGLTRGGGEPHRTGQAPHCHLSRCSWRQPFFVGSASMWSGQRCPNGNRPSSTSPSATLAPSVRRMCLSPSLELPLRRTATRCRTWRSIMVGGRPCSVRVRRTRSAAARRRDCRRSLCVGSRSDPAPLAVLEAKVGTTDLLDGVAGLRCFRGVPLNPGVVQSLSYRTH